MSDFHCRVDGLDGFVRRFKGANQIVTEELKKAGQRSGLAVEAKAKAYAPVWRGHLRRSITSKTTTTSLYSTTTIGTALPYARAIEFGRPAGAPMPPPGALLGWMAAKGIAPAGEFEGRDDLADVATTKRGNGRYYPVEFLIARSIQRNIKKRPFLTKAFKELQPEIRREFAQVPKRVIARLRGGA